MDFARQSLFWPCFRNSRLGLVRRLHMLCERLVEKRLRTVNEPKAAIGATLGSAIRNQMRGKFEFRHHFCPLFCSVKLDANAASPAWKLTLSIVSSSRVRRLSPRYLVPCPQIPFLAGLNWPRSGVRPTAGGLHIISTSGAQSFHEALSPNRPRFLSTKSLRIRSRSQHSYWL